MTLEDLKEEPLEFEKEFLEYYDKFNLTTKVQKLEHLGLIDPLTPPDGVDKIVAQLYQEIDNDYEPHVLSYVKLTIEDACRELMLLGTEA